MKNIIFIDASHVSAKASYDACLNLGFNPIFIVNPDSYKGDTLNGIPTDCLKYADTSDYNNILMIIENEEINDVVAVFSLTDRAMRNAILVGSHLKTATLDKTLLFLLQKETVGNIIPDHSPKTISFTVGNIKKERLYEMVKYNGVIVIKPSETSASIGSFFINSDDDVDKLSTYINDNFSEKLAKGTWLAQQCIEGEFFSVEGYVCNGHVVFLGITYRKRIENTLTAAYFPGEKHLSESIISNAQCAVRSLVVRSGYENGYFHSEFISNSDKPYLIDANFGRIAGGSISQLIADSYSIPLEKLMRHVISLSLFSVSENEFIFPVKQREPCLGITYGVSENCTFEEVVIPNSLQSRHITLSRKGDKLYKTGIDGAGWVGILAGKERDVLLEIEEIKIKNDSGLLLYPAW
ncbi:acetyl-CoA carboxylase biotin carboxylase subunit family protein [Yersinia enterocolitica]|uniref:ATP-grasp domain-containing protein n=1 Tax=Yersinia enterocolitica TaxID=630 RepID=UPI003D089AB3